MILGFFHAQRGQGGFLMLWCLRGAQLHDGCSHNVNDAIIEGACPLGLAHHVVQHRREELEDERLRCGGQPEQPASRMRRNQVLSRLGVPGILPRTHLFACDSRLHACQACPVLHA